MREEVLAVYGGSQRKKKITTWGCQEDEEEATRSVVAMCRERRFVETVRRRTRLGGRSRAQPSHRRERERVLRVMRRAANKCSIDLFVHRRCGCSWHDASRSWDLPKWRGGGGRIEGGRRYLERLRFNSAPSSTTYCFIHNSHRWHMKWQPHSVRVLSLLETDSSPLLQHATTNSKRNPFLHIDRSVVANDVPLRWILAATDTPFPFVMLLPASLCISFCNALLRLS